MIEAVIPAVIAVITGGGVLFTRVHNRVEELDKKVDKLELRVVEAYVSKADFNLSVSKMESALLRIEDKMDLMIAKSLKQ